MKVEVLNGCCTEAELKDKTTKDSEMKVIEEDLFISPDNDAGTVVETAWMCCKQISSGLLRTFASSCWSPFAEKDLLLGGAHEEPAGEGRVCTQMSPL